MTWRIRTARPDDLRFIFDTWSKSFRQHMSPEEMRAGYGKAHREIIAQCIETSTTLVACMDGPDTEHEQPSSIIYGYAVGDTSGHVGLLLHFVYVKDVWRHHGIARALIEALRKPAQNTSVVVTHVPRAHTHRGIPELIRTMGWGTAPFAPFYRYIMKGIADG
jgi:hypothetical protein